MAGTTITHRYPWTVQEMVIIAVLVVGPAAMVLWLDMLAEGDHVQAGLLQVAGLAAAAALYRLGSRRKQASAIRAVLDGTRLVVDGGRVKHSSGDVAGTRTVTAEQMGPETVLALTRGDGDRLKVPMRIAHHPALRGVLQRHLSSETVRVSPEARELLDRL